MSARPPLHGRAARAMVCACVVLATIPRILSAQWSTTFEQHYFADRSNWAFRNTYPAADRLFNAFDELAGRLARETALLDLTAAAVRHLAERAPPPRGARREHQAVALAKIRLRDRLAQDVTLDDLAALTRLNKFHLLEVFRRDVGVSPHVYLTHLRIHEAKRLLAKGRPIAEVAYTVGFADQSHLNRQFKRLVSGVTPGRYQRDSR